MSDSYSAADKLLHRIALGSRAYRKLLFDLERQLFLRDKAGAHDHVFVLGLARAGTTILTRALHDTGQFASLTYDDMPFVLSPNLWRLVTARFSRDISASERAHGDGIEISGASPEALDDVFWSTFCRDAYAGAGPLAPHQPPPAILAAYEQYLRLVMRRYDRNRYLSKNNNNVLRLPALAACFQRSRFLVPIRRPLEHAESLRAQHLRFAASDRFTRDYMGWLGHHEFGPTHRPFSVCPRPGWAGYATDSLDYWLAHWHDMYRYLLPLVRAHANVRFVSYERLCGDADYWPALCAELELPRNPVTFAAPSPRSPADEADPELSRRAEALYERACRL